MIFQSNVELMDFLNMVIGVANPVVVYALYRRRVLLPGGLRWGVLPFSAMFVLGLFAVGQGEPGYIFYVVYVSVLTFMFSRRLPLFQSLVYAFLVGYTLSEFWEVVDFTRSLVFIHSESAWIYMRRFGVILAGFSAMWLASRRRDRLPLLLLSVGVSLIVNYLLIYCGLFSAGDVFHLSPLTQAFYMVNRVASGLVLLYVFYPRGDGVV